MSKRPQRPLHEMIDQRKGLIDNQGRCTRCRDWHNDPQTCRRREQATDWDEATLRTVADHNHPDPCTVTGCRWHDLPGRSTTVHVTLAEVPTDVLVYLAKHSTQQFTCDQITDAVAPADADAAAVSVLNALYLLRDGGYVYRGMTRGRVRWGVTSDGMAAVADALSPPVRGSSDA